MLPYIFLGLYLIIAVLNIIGIVKKIRRLYHITKPLLMLSLCLYCFTMDPSTPDWILIGALFACFVGDVLLMHKGSGWFAAGGFSFFIGHLLFIYKFCTLIDFSDITLILTIVMATIYIAVAGITVYSLRKEAPKKLMVPMMFYLLLNTATNIFAFSHMTSDPGILSVITYIGAVLFFISDCAVYLKRYDKEPPRFFKTDLFVMITYISGIFMIIYGLKPLF